MIFIFFSTYKMDSIVQAVTIVTLIIILLASAMRVGQTSYNTFAGFTFWTSAAALTIVTAVNAHNMFYNV